MATKPDIELVALTKRYGDAVAVDAINLRSPAGTYCCLLGPSGCGKTTTLRMIAGHEEASEGDVILGSENITGLPPAARGTAMMFQSYALFPHLDCTDNVAFSLKMRGVDRDTRRARAREMLDYVRIPESARRMTQDPPELSGGMRQRVMIAMATITGPDLLIADEPTTALDVTVQAQILEILKLLKQDKKTAMALISHDMGVIAGNADQVQVMRHGEVVEHGA